MAFTMMLIAGVTGTLDGRIMGKLLAQGKAARILIRAAILIRRKGPMELMLNLHQWNEELLTATGRQLWGRRTVTYFVCDPVSRRFAPSKFCAYVSIPNQTIRVLPITGATMTMSRYTRIDHGEPIFDGRRAHQHLVSSLAMELVKGKEAPALTALFESWLRPYAAAINVHPVGPAFLVPPTWF
jgi:hypothetical protein